MIRASILAAVILAAALVPALPTSTARAESSPAIAGSITGLEWCVQSLCGSANFVGLYVGAIDEAPATGVWSIRVNHEPLPDEPGESSSVTGGTWWLVTTRGAFRGTVVSGTILNNGDNTFTVELTLAIVTGGVGTMTGEAVLDHNSLPPTVQGTLDQ